MFSKSHLIIPGTDGSPPLKKWHPALEKKLIFPDELTEYVTTWRQEKRKIVTLNGSFDLLHSGHLQMFAEGSFLKGERGVFLVALNSDESIRQYKSPKRPIISLRERLEMVAALTFVDYVTWFEELNPIALLKKIAPDVHVNGSEYGENCIEAETVRQGGGYVHVVDLVPGFSTSQLLEKIRALKE